MHNSTINNKTLQRIQSILQHEQVVWTPECPDPETLWDWQEEGDHHPQAATLFEHLFICAYCREEYRAQWEIRVLTHRVPTQQPTLPGEVRHLSGKIKKRVENWITRLLEEGIVTPLQSMQKTLNRIDRLTATTRGHSSLFDPQPSRTALRTPLPTFRWSTKYPSSVYEIEISRIQPNNRLETVCRGTVSAQMEWTLPEQDRLEPGISYLWYVRTRPDATTIEDDSLEAGFTILSQETCTRLEELEQQLGDSPLARIGVCEAYGLYEEAMQRIDALLALQPEDEVALGLKTTLQHRATSIH